MLWLSEILMQNYDLESFDELVSVLQYRAQQGEMFFSMDVKPPFPDTPENWEEKLEMEFANAGRSR